MAKLKLQVLAPGKRCVGRNADGSKRFIDFTPDYCRQQYERNAALVSARVPVPVCWEHRDDAKPGRLSRDDAASARAKGTAGFVERYELDGGNRVFAVVDIPDESDAKRAEVVRYCSPEINTFTDGSGKDWGEVFTHVALTPRPVQHDQPPAVRLSLTGPIRLAIDPQEGTDMADEKKPDDKGGEGDGDGAGAEFKALVDALKGAGLNIPDEVTDISGLIIAVKASGGDEGDDDFDDMDSDGDDNVREEQPAGGAAGPVSLSLQKQQAQAESLARGNLGQRVTRLLKTNRITPAIADDLRKRVGAVRLSFDSAGEVKANSVTVEIAAYEKLDKDSAFSKSGRRGSGTRLSHGGGPKVREAEAPVNHGDDEQRGRDALKAFESTIGKK